MFWKYDIAKKNTVEVEAVTVADEKIGTTALMLLELTPASELAKYKPRVHCEMQRSYEGLSRSIHKDRLFD